MSTLYFCVVNELKYTIGQACYSLIIRLLLDNPTSLPAQSIETKFSNWIYLNTPSLKKKKLSEGIAALPIFGGQAELQNHKKCPFVDK